MTIKCITLDLDDTLWDCASVIEGAESRFYEWLERHHPDISARYDRDALVHHRRETYLQHPQMLHDFTFLRRQWLTRLAEEAGRDEGFVETGFDVYWRARNAVILFDNVPAVLKSLHASYCVGALTNGNADVDHIGIGHWFDFVVTAADAGHSKPAPAIFHAALAKAGVAPAEALHVGDDPVKDVAGAAAVGMKTVWVNASGEPWPGGEHQPDAVVEHIEQLPDVLASTLSHL